MHYIKTDKDGYVIVASGTPLPDGLPESVEIQDDLDMEKMDCYRYIDGEFEFDAEKWAEREREQAEAELRNRRDGLLKICDHMVMPDYPITEDEREAWRIYRQALRDMPQQPCWPDNVEWPIPPTA